MSAVLTSPGHQELLRKERAPDSSELVDWVSWVFDWSPAQSEQHFEAVKHQLSEINPHETNVIRNSVMPYVSEACRILGLPCDPARHEQPHQLVKLFAYPRASLSLHEFMTHEDDKERPMEPLIPFLLLLWGIKLHEIATQNQCDSPSADQALVITLYDLRDIAYRLLLLLWPDRHELRQSFYVLSTYIDYLIHTRGCFDPESGDLVDRETPTLREFLS